MYVCMYMYICIYVCELDKILKKHIKFVEYFNIIKYVYN